MADILIRMEMPESCEGCPIYDSDYGICNFLSVYYQEDNEGRINGCPLHELPEHGCLIDRDALPQDRVEWDDVVNAPVIVPSNKEETE